ncbi:NADPH-dependent FMN reductase [Oceanobacillus sp. CFH 90083]|uniref:NADPH-dependent FMN reductase n=1 Tax=Oceanobacillus sp. CFH 90083 TaxID=2592336 RepID=UPI0018837837|nr:NADPH-dependent FMN reductase [Oceanobacillus sp. CFH 90083]
MSEVLFLSGSPSLASRTEGVLKNIEASLQEVGEETTFYSITDIPAKDLVEANHHSEAVRSIIAAIEKAQVIIIGTPIYKASFTGVLKALIDLFPQHIFEDKTILPIATGGTIAHYLVLDYSLTPILQSLGAIRILKSIFIVDKQIEKNNDNIILHDESAKERIAKAVHQLRSLRGGVVSIE